MKGITSSILASDPEYSVYVDASAGSGKTTVLVNRLIRLLLTGTDHRKILCLTLSRAAAHTMADRFYNRLKSYLLMPDQALSQSLRDLHLDISPDSARTTLQYLLLGAPIKIQTLHSFCTDILRRSGLLEDTFSLDASTRGQKPEIAQAFLNLLRKIDTEATENCIDKSSDGIQKPDYWTTSQFRIVRSSLDLLLSHYTFSHLITLLNEFFDNLGARIPYEQFVSAADQQHFPAVSFQQDKSKLILEHLQNLKTADYQYLLKDLESADEKVAPFLRKFLQLTVETQLDAFASYTEIFLTKELQKRLRLQISSKFLQGSWRHFLLSEQDKLFTLWQRIKEIEQTHLHNSFLIIAKAVHHECQHFSAPTFNDIITSALTLLREHEHDILYQLDLKLDHILVDEAQDLSAVQWQVIKTLTAEFYAGHGSRGNVSRTIFIVGDFKQSIFSFQGSKPKIFQSIKDFYRTKFSKWREVELHYSFRSGKEILQEVDRICNDLRMLEAFGVPTVQHHYENNQHHGQVTVWRIASQSADTTKTLQFTDDSRSAQSLSAEEEEAEPTKHTLPNSAESPYLLSEAQEDSIAKYISQQVQLWLDSGRLIHDTQKQVKAADILVLVRKRSPLQSKIVQHLRARAVPVDDQCGIDDDQPLRDVIICLCQFLAAPNDDLNLASLLRSPLIRIREEDLFRLCHKRVNSLWNNLQQDPILQNQYSILKQLLEKSYTTYTAYQFFSHFLTLNLLPESWPNLKEMVVEFQQLLLQYHQECSSHGSIHYFADWFQKTKSLPRSAGDAVKINTIHGAKGSEAPIVILPELHHLGTVTQLQDPLMISDNGFMLRSGRLKQSAQYKTFYKACQKDMNDEARRLLYVALTRAQNELYLVT